VHNASDLTDYAGELDERTVVRLTDGASGPSGDEAATIEDFPASVPVPCTATPSTAIGATCSTSTSLNAIAPGTVVQGARAIWQLGYVQVFDGGPDGRADTTGDNALFARQGVFVP
jgi:hypothetical protein